MARYRKVDPRIWADEKFRSISSSEKLIALYTVTAQANRAGIFLFSPAKGAEDLEMSVETFTKGFLNVCRTFGWHWDSRVRVLYIPTWWKYNQPENANVLVGALSDVHEVPKVPPRFLEG